MGHHQSIGSPIIDNKFLRSLNQSTPLKHLNPNETQVHEIPSISQDHHHIMLEKIRIKKKYDCPYLVRIIDSHTVQSKNLCSSITKLYIVVQKPQSLAQQIQQRMEMKMGFLQAQVWTLVYSCCKGGQYLVKNNVALSRLNKTKVFIDLDGGIKINDPDFAQGPLNSQRINEYQFIESIGEIAQQLTSIENPKYSKKLLDLISMMLKQDMKLTNLLEWIVNEYLMKNSKSIANEGFSSAKKNKSMSSMKKNGSKLKILSGRKNAQAGSLTQNLSQSKKTPKNFQLSYNSQNKENLKSNEPSSSKRPTRGEIFTFKDSMKGLNEINIEQLPMDSHFFPKKALFGQKRKNSTKTDSKISADFTQGSQVSRSTSKQVLTRESHSHSFMGETQQSLSGSQLTNMISYQVDQETFVREINHDQSQYFLQLMNQCKYTIKNGHN